MSKKTTFMNIKTGSVGHYDDWYYETETGEIFNAVDVGEVVPVHWSPVWDTWVESDEHKIVIIK
jgi:hypothetical protein